MSTTHSPGNINEIVEYTDEITDIDNQFGFIRSQNIFSIKPTSQTSLLFDKQTNNIRLIPASNPRAKSTRNVGKDNVVEQFAMGLLYYNDDDYITVQDIQDQRMPGKIDTAETLANVRADKLENLKMAHDQTDEKLRFEAMKGDLPVGAVAGQTTMYGLFGLNIGDFTVDLDTANVAVDLDGKIAEVARKMSLGLKSGTKVSGIDFYMDEALFDEMINNPKFRDVFNHYQNSGSQRLRDQNAEFFTWGVVNHFEYRGYRFMSYNPEFEEDDGTLVKVLGAGDGIAVPRNARDMFRGYHGPANKLSAANRPGSELFVWERPTVDDEGYILETQARKLYWATKPSAIIQLT